jgi:hydrocephalus-inducing protein
VYSSVAVQVAGREARLPLQLRGNGIGPKAVFSSDVIDIGDVFVTSVHKYEIEMMNKGDIVCEFSVITPQTPFGPSFVFEPSSGAIAVGASQQLSVTFSSNLLGEFSETFDLVMKGSNERLRALFKGHVIAPTFHLDVDDIDFGTVAFEFLNTREFCMFNTATVPFKYRFRVPEVSPGAGGVRC